VFLVKCSTKDAELLFSALDCRLNSLRAAEADSEGEGESPADTKRARPQEESAAAAQD